MRRKIIATAVAAGVIAAACGAEVSPEQLRKSLIDQGIDTELATCVVDDLEANLSEDDFNTIATADESLSGVDDKLASRVFDTIADCSLEATDTTE